MTVSRFSCFSSVKTKLSLKCPIVCHLWYVALFAGHNFRRRCCHPHRFLVYVTSTRSVYLRKAYSKVKFSRPLLDICKNCIFAYSSFSEQNILDVNILLFSVYNERGLCCFLNCILNVKNRHYFTLGAL